MYSAVNCLIILTFFGTDSIFFPVNQKACIPAEIAGLMSFSKLLPTIATVAEGTSSFSKIAWINWETLSTNLHQLYKNNPL